MCEYDQRSGGPENSFCQDYQALSLRKYRKTGLIAQQVLLLLFELAHNLMIWMKKWFIEAVETPKDALEKIENAPGKATKMLEELGLKRLRRGILVIPGRSALKKVRRSLAYGSTLYTPLYSTPLLLSRHFSDSMKYSR